jgi:hypothetical protein
MTNKEKGNNPDYKILSGYLKTFEYKESWKNLWGTLSKEDKEVIKDLPNFDKNIFKEITGVIVK